MGFLNDYNIHYENPYLKIYMGLIYRYKILILAAI